MSIIPQMPPATARVLTAAGTLVSDWFKYLRDAALYGFFESIFCKGSVEVLGNIGIGTSSPDGKLHLNSGTSGDCVLVIEADTDNNDEGDVPQIWFKADGDLNEALIGLNNNFLDILSNVTPNGGIRFFLGATSNYGSTSPYTGAAEAARFSSAGNLGIGGTPNAAAILDLQSTTKGLKLPVMTAAQRAAITAVAGLMVFDSTDGKSYTYDGAIWNAHY